MLGKSGTKDVEIEGYDKKSKEGKKVIAETIKKITERKLKEKLRTEKIIEIKPAKDGGKEPKHTMELVNIFLSGTTTTEELEDIMKECEDISDNLEKAEKQINS